MDDTAQQNAETEAVRQDRARRQKVVADARRFLTHLASLVRQLGVHDPSNEAVKSVLADLTRDLFELHRTAPAVAVVFAEGHTFVNGVWVRSTGRAWESAVYLTEVLLRVDARGVRFEAGTAAPELLAITQRFRQIAAAREAPGRLGLDTGIHGVTLIERPPDEAVAEDGRSRFRREAAEVLHEGLLALSPSALAKQDIFVRRRQRALVLRLVQMAEETPEDLLTLTAVRDPTIVEVSHNLMVAILAIALGRLMDFRRRDLVRLGVCALGHNVGEALLPAGLLTTERELSPEEVGLLQQHPLLGMVQLLDEFGFEIPIVERALAAAEHHLHVDGGGYPEIGHTNPHLFARIIAVADVYAALTEPRPNREPFPPDQAVKLVSRRGGAQLDPVLVRLFVGLVGRYPPGSLVELDTGEFALVVGAGRGLKPLIRPRVVLLTDADGYELEELVVVDLGERHAKRRAWKRTIVRTRDPKNLDAPVARFLMADRAEPTPEKLDIDDDSLQRKPISDIEAAVQRRFAIASPTSAPADLSAFGLGVSQRDLTRAPTGAPRLASASASGAASEVLRPGSGSFDTRRGASGSFDVRRSASGSHDVRRGGPRGDGR
ncbi:MAG: hypothetical protein H6698_02880 [Myxococcales bacterium]|nr:hypothetical protein [Myxococcales bacterium]MCB9519516.1 hypothetical protein [Myxococcales bacterium]MCB9533259.1 hypothetical protein [Myxococcales bacterium]